MTSRLLQMLCDLESHRLEVVLVPLNPNRRGWNEGGCRRVVCDCGPRWYRAMCARHTSSRAVRRGKHDTRIRRQTILGVLRRLVNGQRSWSKYAPEILGVAKGAG